VAYHDRRWRQNLSIRSRYASVRSSKPARGEAVRPSGSSTATPAIARDVIFICKATPGDNEFALWLGPRLEEAGYTVFADLLTPERFGKCSRLVRKVMPPIRPQLTRNIAFITRPIHLRPRHDQIALPVALAPHRHPKNPASAPPAPHGISKIRTRQRAVMGCFMPDRPALRRKSETSSMSITFAKQPSCCSEADTSARR
jgi:hypothetical protein